MEKLKNLLSPGKAIDDETLYGAFPEVKAKHSMDDDVNQDVKPSKDARDAAASSASQEKPLGSQVINRGSDDVPRYPIDAGFTPIEQSQQTKIGDDKKSSPSSASEIHETPKAPGSGAENSGASTQILPENSSSHTTDQSSITAAKAAAVAANASSTKDPTITGATAASAAQSTQVAAAKAAVNPRDMPGAFPGADPKGASHHLDAATAGGAGTAEIAAQKAYSKQNPDAGVQESEANPYASTLVDSRVDPHSTQPTSGAQKTTASTNSSHSVTTAPPRGIDHQYGRGAGLAAAAGAAGLGAYSATNKHQDDNSITGPSTGLAGRTSAAVPTTSSSGYHAGPVGTAVSQTSTSTAQDHAPTRNPALGQGITSGAASGEIMSRGRDDYSTASPSSSHPDQGSSIASPESNLISNTGSSTGADDGGRAFPLTGGTSQTPAGQSAHQTQAASRLDQKLDSAETDQDDKHHYGRDAVVAGGVGAAGLAAYESNKHHDEKEAPSDRLAGQPGTTDPGAPGLTGTAPGQAIGQPDEKSKGQKHLEKEAEKETEKAQHKAEKETEKAQHKAEKESEKKDMKEHRKLEKAIEKEEKKEAKEAEKAHKKAEKDTEKETSSKPSFFSRLLGLGGQSKEEETEAEEEKAKEDEDEHHRGRNAALAAGAGAGVLGVGAYAASKHDDDKVGAASEAAPSKVSEPAAAAKSPEAHTSNPALPKATTEPDHASGLSSATDPGAPGITGTAPGQAIGDPSAKYVSPEKPSTINSGTTGITGTAPGQSVREPSTTSAYLDRSDAEGSGASGTTGTAPGQAIDESLAKGAKKPSEENLKGRDAVVGGGILAAAAGVAGYGYEKQFKESKYSSSSYPYNFSSEPRADADGIGAAPVGGMKYEKVNKEKQKSSSYPYSFSSTTGATDAKTDTISNDFRDVPENAADTGAASAQALHENVKHYELDDRDPLDTSAGPNSLNSPEIKTKDHHHGRDAAIVAAGAAAAGYGAHEMGKDKENQGVVSKATSDAPAVSHGSKVNYESTEEKNRNHGRDVAGVGAGAVAAGYGVHKASEQDQKPVNRGPTLSDTSHSSKAYSASPKDSRTSLDRAKQTDDSSHREDRPRKQSLVTKVLSSLKDKDNKRTEHDHTHGKETAAVGAGVASAASGAHEHDHEAPEEKKDSHGRKPSLIKRILHLEKKEDDTSPRTSSERARKSSDKSRKSSDKYRDEAAVGVPGVPAAGIAALGADSKQTPASDRVTYAADYSVGQSQNRTSGASAIGNEVVDSEPSSTEFTSAQKGKQAAEPESAFGGIKSGYQTHPLGTMRDVGDDHAAHWEDVLK